MIGDEILAFAKELYPINRSLTGSGVRETLRRIGHHLPELQSLEVSSGSSAFDWTVPDEWEISEAYLEDPSGKRIIDFANHNLHVIGYSSPVDITISLDELQGHLHSIPEMPDAIPYVTSYYADRWGFCISHRQRVGLQQGNYRAVIRSRKFKGVMNYGELVIPGNSKKEVLLSTYVCHPSMANNETSGPAVLTFVGKWLLEHSRRYTYRIIFAPETIGAIHYISKNLNHLKQNVIAGFNVSCVGDDRNYSFVESRKGVTLADRIAEHVLPRLSSSYVRHSFLERQSDERQYGSVLVDLPFIALCRTKYGCYEEYHTSMDDFSVVTATGLEGGFNLLTKCITALESNRTFIATTICEPQLGKRGLYPTLGGGKVSASVNTLLNVLEYCDGSDDLLTIAERCGLSITTIAEAAELLEKNGLLREIVAANQV
jgi:aminopeptidase-like protein